MTPKESLHEKALATLRLYGEDAAPEKFYTSREVQRLQEEAGLSDEDLDQLFDTVAAQHAYERGNRNGAIENSSGGPAHDDSVVVAVDAGSPRIVDSRPPTPENPLLGLGYIQSVSPTPLDYVVNPFFVAGELGLIYAQWKAGKTFVCLSLALAIATGTKWLGEFDVPRPRRVLYIDEEMSRVELIRRVQRLSPGMSTDQFRVLSRYGLSFDSADTVKTLVGKLQEAWDFDPEVVFVDSFRAVFPGNEKEAHEVRRFWKDIEALLQGRTVIFIHHMKKPPLEGRQDPRHAASGSTDLMAGPDAALSIQRKAGDLLLIENPACRHQPERTPFSVVMEDIGRKTVLRFAGDYVAPSKTAAAQPRVVKFVRDAGEKGASRAEIGAAFPDVAPRTMTRVIKAAEKAGDLRKSKKGWWVAVPPPESDV